ncbi:copper amine oxidase N-terminal domain-containing protein [Paenibacillus spongiae]|uniref:Copper amine oxidase N-terminal domain-containing protein n=1 Tax=Paenibacillus spongiae TaxID=2909671 RepID=A0ABY5S343_9BACL|nr:copper amine oxidase N-terminal domain-containing protein [Paenibacillus spongiae]UVI28297.1 copper amine oxidase N-terminal domain-containing protein [Paenibacillus spongiae]
MLWLGATVVWNPKDSSITAKKADTTIQLKLGSVRAKKNNQEITLGAAAQLVNTHTMVPLRFISESLGADVKCDPTTKTITITTQG